MFCLLFENQRNIIGVNSYGHFESPTSHLGRSLSHGLRYLTDVERYQEARNFRRFLGFYGDGKIVQ